MVKKPFRIAILAVFAAFALAHSAFANLVKDGNFTQVTYSGSLSLSSTLYGEFGPSADTTLTVTSWSTTGYNFVYAPNTADVGGTSGANSGAPNEAPGQYNTSAGYGNTYMWGSKNGGTITLPATDPAGGNFIAADGAYETGAISQTVTGLTAGERYLLTFYWGAAQQQSYSGATTEWWTITMGTQSFTTGTYSLASHSFSGWMGDILEFTATGSKETLSFLAGGTPDGEPPFSLLGGVNLEVVPEFSNWMVFAGFGLACTVIEVVRRRRHAAAAAD